jgi:hypothetical protein
MADLDAVVAFLEDLEAGRRAGEPSITDPQELEKCVARSCAVLPAALPPPCASVMTAVRAGCCRAMQKAATDLVEQADTNLKVRASLTAVVARLLESQCAGSLIGPSCVCVCAPLQLAQRMAETREALQKLDAEEREAAAVIIGFVAPDSDPARYSSMSIEQLLREVPTGSGGGGAASGSGAATAAAPVQVSPMASMHTDQGQLEIQALEEYVSCARRVVAVSRVCRVLSLRCCVAVSLSVVVCCSRKAKLEQRIAKLKESLEQATGMDDEEQGLRQDVHEAAEQFRNEKEARARAIAELQEANRRVCVDAVAL